MNFFLSINIFYVDYKENSLFSYMEPAFFVCLPIVTTFVYAFYLLMKRSFVKQKESIKPLKVFFNIFFFFAFLYQPCIISSLFSTLECVSLDPQPGGRYIRRYLTEKCFTNLHFSWIIIFVLPSLIFYIFAVPAIEFWRQKQSNRLNINKSLIYW